MANEKNIGDSINVLKRVRDRSGKFNLKSWQEVTTPISAVVKSEEELHNCGMSASIGGHNTSHISWLGGEDIPCGDEALTRPPETLAKKPWLTMTLSGSPASERLLRRDL